MIYSQNSPDPLQRLAQIDAICLEFEKQRQSQKLTIEEALAGLPAELHAEVIPELLWIEWSQRRKSGESIRLEEYLARFPQHPSVVRKSWSRDLRHLREESPDNASEIWGNRYRILHVHAAGGLGRIFIADDLQLDRKVAIKEVNPELSDQPNVCERFLREARITANLEHPGVAPVYSLDLGEEHPPYFAMRLIDGETLQEEADKLHRQTVASGTTPSRDDRRDFFRTLQFRELLSRLQYICKVVDFAHSRGVIHRDIKPGNIILGRHGETMLVDWGLAKAPGEADSVFANSDSAMGAESKSEQLTHDSELVGTPAFMSPEQALRSPEANTAATDIYSLGATLHYLLAGVPPRGASRLGSPQVAAAPREYLFPATTPRALQAICRTATAALPQDRYQSAGELAHDLECWLADLPVKALPEKLPARTARFVKRHQPWFIAVSLGILGVGLIGWLYNLSLSNANRKLTEEQNRLEMARFDQERLSDEAKAHSQRVTQLLLSLNPNVSLLNESDLRKRIDQWLLESAQSFALNADQPDSLVVLNSQIESLQALGYYSETTAIVKQAIKAREERNLSLEPLKNILKRVAETPAELNRVTELLEQDLNARPSLLTPAQHAVLVADLGHCYLQVERYDDLRNLIEEHFETARRNLQSDDLYQVKLTELSALMHHRSGRHKEAIQMIRQARAETPDAVVPKGLSSLKLDQVEAQALLSLGQSDAAIGIYERMLTGFADSVAPDHPAMISVHLEYGNALRDNSRAQTALDVHLKCLKDIQSSNRGKKNLNEADFQHAIALDLTALKNFSEAEKQVDQAIAFYRANLAAGDRRLLSTLQAKGAILLDSERYTEAVPLLESIVADSQKYFGEQHQDTLEAKNKLAVAYFFAEQIDEGIKMLQQCFHTSVQLHGEAHAESLHYLGNLCTVYVMAGKVAEGGEFIEKNYALAISDPNGIPPGYINRAASHLGLLHLECNRLSEAWDLLTTVLEAESDAGAPINQATIESLSYVFRIAEQTGSHREAAELHLKILESAPDRDKLPAAKLAGTDINHLRLWRKTGLEPETMHALQILETRIISQLPLEHPLVHQAKTIKAAVLFEFGHVKAAENLLTETRNQFPAIGPLDQFQIADLLWLIACKQSAGEVTVVAELRQSLPESLREVDLSQPRIEVINAIAIQATTGGRTNSESEPK